MKPIDVKRSTVTLDPDPTHVLARPFRLMSHSRSVKIAARVMALPENEVHTLLDGVRAEFGDRQLKIDEFLYRRFDEVSPYLLNGQRLSEERKLLLGGYFTHEYSLEAAALFNPSVGSAARLPALHPEPARHGRRARFLDRVSERSIGRPQ
jgi:hypothetical protein